MASLSEVLADPGKRKRVVDDGVAMIEAEVAEYAALRDLDLRYVSKLSHRILTALIAPKAQM